jgi:hypothetical protein
VKTIEDEAARRYAALAVAPTLRRKVEQALASAHAIRGQLMEEAARLTGPIPGSDGASRHVPDDAFTDAPGCKLYMGTPGPDRMESLWALVRINQHGQVTLSLTHAGDSTPPRVETLDLVWDWRILGWRSAELDTEAVVANDAHRPFLSAPAAIWKRLAAMTEAAFGK